MHGSKSFFDADDLCGHQHNGAEQGNPGAIQLQIRQAPKEHAEVDEQKNSQNKRHH